MATLNGNWRIYQDPVYDGRILSKEKLNPVIEYDSIDEVWYCRTCQRLLDSKSIYEIGSHNCSGPHHVNLLGQGDLFSGRMDFSYLKRMPFAMGSTVSGRGINPGSFLKFTLPIIRHMGQTIIPQGI